MCHGGENKLSKGGSGLFHITWSAAKFDTILLAKSTAQFIALNKTRVFISLLTRTLATVCQLNPVHTTALYFVMLLSYRFPKWSKILHTTSSAFYTSCPSYVILFIAFRAINRIIAKRKTVQISAVPTLCHMTWCIQNRDRKYWEGEGRNILKLIYRKSIPVM